MKQRLSLKTLHLLDGGRVGVQTDIHIAALVKDIEERPADDTAATIINLRRNRPASRRRDHGGHGDFGVDLVKDPRARRRSA